MPGPPLNPDRMTIEPRSLESSVALLSIDVESDYGTGRREALSQIGRLIDLLAELGVPLTAFVEGRFFEQDRPLCRRLLDAGVDVQLHCWNHGDPGDTPDSLRRSHAAFAQYVGGAPAGYRAHTYRLTQELYETLLDLGFSWDSSLQRGLGQGSQRHPRLLEGDYLIFDGRLLEFPIGTWRRLPLPFNHTYRLLAKTWADACLWAISGPVRLATYNMHMTDLVRSDSLRFAVRSRVSRYLHRYAWSMQGEDTFGALRTLVGRLRQAQYEFLTTSALHTRLVG